MELPSTFKRIKSYELEEFKLSHDVIDVIQLIIFVTKATSFVRKYKSQPEL